MPLDRPEHEMEKVTFLLAFCVISRLQIFPIFITGKINYAEATISDEEDIESGDENHSNFDGDIRNDIESEDEESEELVIDDSLDDEPNRMNFRKKRQQSNAGSPAKEGPPVKVSEPVLDLNPTMNDSFIKGLTEDPSLSLIESGIEATARALCRKVKFPPKTASIKERLSAMISHYGKHL